MRVYFSKVMSISVALYVPVLRCLVEMRVAKSEEDELKVTVAYLYEFCNELLCLGSQTLIRLFILIFVLLKDTVMI